MVCKYPHKRCRFIPTDYEKEALKFYKPRYNHCLRCGLSHKANNQNLNKLEEDNG